MGVYCTYVMSAQTEKRSHTTLWVSKNLATRLDELKPYESLTWDEFLAMLADTYEENQT
jgi:hypothetical protein